MNLQLTEQQKRQVEQQAVQEVITDIMLELVKSRVKQIKEELAEDGATYTVQDIGEKYLNASRVVTPPVGILVPK